MKKERSRFDALAEELEGDKPEPEKPRKTLTAKARARLDDIVAEYKPSSALPADFDAEDGSEYKFPPPPQPSVRRSKAVVRVENNAYLTAMGVMWPVVEFHMTNQSVKDLMTMRDPYDERLDRNLSRLTVTIKLAGRLDEKKIREGDPALVVRTGESEPSYYRLNITQWNLMMSSAQGVWTEIEAEARQIQ